MPLLIAVMGPTASGKTPLAELISARLSAKLVNADAFQVYRGMDVGTAKPLDKSRYELLDIKNPNEAFGVGEWVSRALPILESAFEQGQHLIVVGGTGLYIRALFEEYEAMNGSPHPDLRERVDACPIEKVREELQTLYPERAAKVDLKNPVRVRRALEKALSPTPEPVTIPPFKKLKLGIIPTAEVLGPRIEQRVDQMLQNGWVSEIEGLRERGFHRQDPAFRAIGYRSLWDAIDGKIGFEEASATTIAETRQYAKRQRTWLRSEPDLIPLLGDSLTELAHLAMEQVDNALK